MGPAGSFCTMQMGTVSALLAGVVLLQRLRLLRHNALTERV